MRPTGLVLMLVTCWFFDSSSVCVSLRERSRNWLRARDYECLLNKAFFFFFDKDETLDRRLRALNLHPFYSSLFNCGELSPPARQHAKHLD